MNEIQRHVREALKLIPSVDDILKEFPLKIPISFYKRQIKRWINFAGPKGRWKIRLISNIIRNNSDFDDINISPVIRQGLQHWGYKLTKSDIENVKWNSDF